MKPQAIEKWVAEKSGRYIAQYGLSHWQITVEVDRDEEADCYGEVVASPQYERATIYIYAAMIYDEQQLHETLCHELEHVLHSPFLTYKACVDKYLPKAASAAMDELYSHCVELARSNIGRFRANFLSDPP